MTGLHPRWRTPLAAILSGLLFALAFPPVEWVVLLPLALVPWLACLAREESRARALWSGVLFGVAHWCASIPWIFYVVTRYGGQSSAMGVVCLVILSLILAEWPAIVAWGTVAVAPPGSPWRMAAFPLLWMATEHVRSELVYGGFPWNLVGQALYHHPVWLQTASIWGVYGVGALVVALSALLAAGITRARLMPMIFAALLVLAAGIFGTLRLAAPRPDRPELPVALLQPNLTEEMRLSPGGTLATYRSVLAQASEAAEGQPALIVIPESALPVYWNQSETLRQDLAALAQQGPDILFNDVEELPDGSYYNVARLLARGGLAGPPYRKVHLVPFGEYVPLPRVFFFVRKISTAIGAFNEAAAPTVVRSGALAIGTAICYETIYPSVARLESTDGANLLVTISNDSWYGRGGAQEQHFAGAVLRSVENDRYLVRAAITGISGVVDARGRILVETRPNERTLVRSGVRLETGRTAWNRWGFRIPGAADALAGAVLVFAFVRWVRRRRLSERDPRPARTP